MTRVTRVIFLRQNYLYGGNRRTEEIKTIPFWWI